MRRRTRPAALRISRTHATCEWRPGDPSASEPRRRRSRRRREEARLRGNDAAVLSGRFERGMNRRGRHARRGWGLRREFRGQVVRVDGWSRPAVPARRTSGSNGERFGPWLSAPGISARNLGESVSYTGLEPSSARSPWSAVAAGGVFASSAWTGGLEEALSSGEPLGEPIEGVDGESASTGGLEASGCLATGAGLPPGEMKGLRNAGLRPRPEGS